MVPQKRSQQFGPLFASRLMFGVKYLLKYKGLFHKWCRGDSFASRRRGLGGRRSNVIANMNASGGGLQVRRFGSTELSGLFPEALMGTQACLAVNS